jgi:hypothetical protein
MKIASTGSVLEAEAAAAAKRTYWFLANFSWKYSRSLCFG